MRVRPKQTLLFISCLFLSFFVLLYAVTAYRENSYNDLVQSFQLPEEMKLQAMDEAREYQRDRLEVFTANSPQDEVFNDPVMIEYIAETHANALNYEYYFRFDLVPEIGKKEPCIFPLRFFHIYGKLYSFENLQHAGALGIVLSYNLGPFFDGGSVFDDMATTIHAWESEGNIREGEWLDRFEASPQYEAFLQDLYARIEFLDGKSLESLVKEIQEIPAEASSPLNNLKAPFLKDAQKLANVVYESYQSDKKQGDIARVTLETKILQELYEKVQYTERLSPYQCRSLHWPESILPDPFIDLAGILIGSITISFVVTRFLSTKYWD